LSAIFATFIVASTFLSISFASSTVSSTPCFYFTSGNSQVGGTICNSAANDITVFFKPGPNCIVAFGTAGLPCPKGANNIDVTWGINAAGGLAITSCAWTKNNVTLPISCNLTSPSPTSFNVIDPNGSTTTIVKVFWTINGAKLGKVIKPPAGVVVNNLEFTV
jgi:hypothetical protein